MLKKRKSLRPDVHPFSGWLFYLPYMLDFQLELFILIFLTSKINFQLAYLIKNKVLDKKYLLFNNLYIIIIILEK